MTTIASKDLSAVTQKSSKDDKQQATIKRVQTEFLRQIGKGKSEVEAFENSLKAIDEKYNPKEDNFQKEGTTVSNFNNVGEDCQMSIPDIAMKVIKIPSGPTIITWLKYIADIIPIIFEIINKIPKGEKKPEEEVCQAA